MLRTMRVVPVMLISAIITVTLSSCEEKSATAEDIVIRCAEALGGLEKINALNTIRVNSIYPDHGENSIVFEIKRPNLSRSAGGKLVFDGKRACWIKGIEGNSEPQFVAAEEWIDFDVEIAYFFPAFFEYPYELIGMETIDRREFYKLKVVLPLGATMTYLIDTETSLPVKAQANFTLHEKEYNPYRDYFDYKEVDGLYLPHGFTYGSRHGQIKGWVTSWEINVQFEEDYFNLPPER